MGSFSELQSAVVGATGTTGIGLPPGVSGATSAAANVGGIVGALSQFDPNGNPVGMSPAALSVPSGPSLTTPLLPSSVSTGILVSGK
jgi:hypothetical protein